MVGKYEGCLNLMCSSSDYLFCQKKGFCDFSDPPIYGDLIETKKKKQKNKTKQQKKKIDRLEKKRNSCILTLALCSLTL